MKRGLNLGVLLRYFRMLSIVVQIRRRHKACQCRPGFLYLMKVCSEVYLQGETLSSCVPLRANANM